MTFFYDLNKRLADLATKQDLTESIGSTSGFLEASTGDYSAKKARAGKDIGKPGKMFSKIAKSAGKEYGSKAAGERVAGAVLNKLRAKEGVEESEMDESAFQAAIGKKKYGEKGMKALQKAGRDHASDKTMDTIRNRYDKYDESMTDEGNAFTGALAKTPKGGKFKVGNKEFTDTSSLEEVGQAPMTPKQKSFAKLAPPANKITFADKIAGAKKEVDEMLGDVAAEAIKKAVKKSEPRSKGTVFDPEVAKGMFAHKDDSRYDVKDTGYSKRYTRKVQDEPEADDEKSDAPKVKGRPKGSKRAIGAKGPTGKSKLMSKGAIKEVDMDPTDHGEYDREGDMAKEQMHTIMSAAKELHSMLKDEENLPEWVQKKITLAKEYIDSARDYMSSQHAERAEEPIAEKAVSKKQQKFMGMVHAAQKGEKPASKAVSKVAKEMPKKAAKDFAATKHKGLPEKVKAKKEESVEETADAPAEKKAKGGYNFGGSVYESLNRQFKQALTEGMNVSVNMSTDAQGQPSKNITISADGEDADKLAELLKMAGLGGDTTCPTCGNADCGCEELDENSPDWPTNTETSDDAMQYSGGLNGPKSTGQTTVPVIASQLRRQVSMEESVELERSLFRLFQNYKAQ
jgi:hypothetical protein